MDVSRDHTLTVELTKEELAAVSECMGFNDAAKVELTEVGLDTKTWRFEGPKETRVYRITEWGDWDLQEVEGEDES